MVHHYKHDLDVVLLEASNLGNEKAVRKGSDTHLRNALVSTNWLSTAISSHCHWLRDNLHFLLSTWMLLIIHRK